MDKIKDYNSLEEYGLNYIKKQENYIKYSIIFPIYSIIIQIFNIFFILNAILLDRIPEEPNLGGILNPPPGPPPIFDQLTPTIIIIVFSIIAIIKIYYLRNWKISVENYNVLKKSLKLEDFRNPESELPDNRSISDIFYDIVDNMEVVRKLFALLNIIAIFYSQWYVRYFIMLFSRINPHPAHNIFQFIMQILNFISQIGLIVYLYYEWGNFLSWNKKLKNLRKLEQQVFDEINIDDDSIGENEL